MRFRPWLKAGVNADELTRIKTQVRAATIYARDDAGGLAQMYGQALTVGLTVQDVQDWPDVLQSVTADELGGPEAHMHYSGNVHFIAEDDAGNLHLANLAVFADDLVFKWSEINAQLLRIVHARFPDCRCPPVVTHRPFPGRCRPPTIVGVGTDQSPPMIQSRRLRQGITEGFDKTVIDIEQGAVLVE